MLYQGAIVGIAAAISVAIAILVRLLFVPWLLKKVNEDSSAHVAPASAAPYGQVVELSVQTGAQTDGAASVIRRSESPTMAPLLIEAADSPRSAVAVDGVSDLEERKQAPVPKLNTKGWNEVSVDTVDATVSGVQVELHGHGCLISSCVMHI